MDAKGSETAKEIRIETLFKEHDTKVRVEGRVQWAARERQRGLRTAPMLLLPLLPSDSLSWGWRLLVAELAMETCPSRAIGEDKSLEYGEGGHDFSTGRKRQMRQVAAEE